MKKLKGFVQQMAKLEGSMVEGYIVYESFYYASEYIKKIDETSGIVIWEDQLDEDKRERDLIEMNEKRRRIRSNPLIFYQIICREKLFTLKFIIYL